MPAPTLVGTPAFVRYSGNLSMAVGTDANLMIGSWRIADGGPSATFSGTYNGDTMSEAERTDPPPSSPFEDDAVMMYRESPDTGTVDLDPGSSTGTVVYTGGCSVKDVELTGGPFRATVQTKAASSTSVSITVTGCTADDLAVAWVHVFGATTASGGDVHSQANSDNLSLILLVGTGATDKVLTTTLGSAFAHHIVAGAVRGASASGSGRLVGGGLVRGSLGGLLAR